MGVALVGEIPSMVVVGSTHQQEEGILPQGKVVQIMIITFYSYYTRHLTHRVGYTQCEDKLVHVSLCIPVIKFNVLGVKIHFKWIMATSKEKLWTLD